MMRQIGKQILTLAAWLLLALAARADGLVTLVVTDPLTGIAIDGYDPVSYFTEKEPLPGRPDYEFIWQGVPWFFANAANRDVFMRSPEVYAPQYGGHCLTALSRGYLSDGKPRLYVIDAMKLYLFYSTANRDAFLLSRSEALKSAASNWPKLSKELIGPNGSEPASKAIAAGSAEPSVAPPDTGGNLGASDSAETSNG